VLDCQENVLDCQVECALDTDLRSASQASAAPAASAPRCSCASPIPAFPAARGPCHLPQPTLRQPRCPLLLRQPHPLHRPPGRPRLAQMHLPRSAWPGLTSPEARLPLLACHLSNAAWWRAVELGPLQHACRNSFVERQPVTQLLGSFSIVTTLPDDTHGSEIFPSSRASGSSSELSCALCRQPLLLPLPARPSLTLAPGWTWAPPSSRPLYAAYAPSSLPRPHHLHGHSGPCAMPVCFAPCPLSSSELSWRLPLPRVCRLSATVLVPPRGLKQQYVTE